MKRIVLLLFVCASPIAAMNNEAANQLLMAGARTGNLEGVQTALENGADVNFVEKITG